jgi:hypothetical protein
MVKIPTVSLRHDTRRPVPRTLSRYHGREQSPLQPSNVVIVRTDELSYVTQSACQTQICRGTPVAVQVSLSPRVLLVEVSFSILRGWL